MALKDPVNMGVFEYADSVLANVLNSVKENILNNVQSQLQTIILLLMIVVVILIGYKMILGKFSSSSEFLSAIIKILVVYLAVYGFSEYSYYVDDFVKALNDFFTGLIPFNLDDGKFTVLDKIIKKSSKSILNLEDTVDSLFFTISCYVLIAFIWLICAIAFLFLIISDSLLTLFIGIGPLFFCFFLFEPTRQFFTSWIQAILSILIFTLITLFIIYITVKVEEFLIDHLMFPQEVKKFVWRAKSGEYKTVTKYFPSLTVFNATLIWSICSFFLLLAAIPITQQLAAGAGVPLGSIHRTITAPVTRGLGYLQQNLSRSRYDKNGKSRPPLLRDLANRSYGTVQNFLTSKEDSKSSNKGDKTSNKELLPSRSTNSGNNSNNNNLRTQATPLSSSSAGGSTQNSIKQENTASPQSSKQTTNNKATAAVPHSKKDNTKISNQSQQSSSSNKSDATVSPQKDNDRHVAPQETQKRYESSQSEPAVQHIRPGQNRVIKKEETNQQKPRIKNKHE